MALFQTPATTPEEIAKGAPLNIPPSEVAEMTEAEWYEKAYRGDDAPQLTVRAVLMGSGLGFLLAFTNVYIGLKTGWHLGVAITACILSFSIWQLLLGLKIAKTPMSILENNCMQSTASAAGYSTGGTMVSAIPALLMLSVTEENPEGTHLSIVVLLIWTFLLAVLGTSLAIPMKRNMINQERLKFPSGLAAAATLQSLYASGEEASRKGKALAYSALFGSLFPILMDLQISKFVRDTNDNNVDLTGQALTDAIAAGTVTAGRESLVAGSQKIFDFLPGAGVDRVTGEPFKPSSWTMVMDMNPVMIAAGALVGLRVTVWMTLGGLVLAYIVGPMGYEAGWAHIDPETGNEIVTYATTKPHKAWKEIGLWIGAPMMVASGLLSFAFQWRTILRAFKSLAGGGGEEAAPPPKKSAQGANDNPFAAGRASDEEVTKPVDPSLIAAVEVPTSWFVVGAGGSGIGIAILAYVAFDIPLHFGVLAVVLTFFLALVAARATGESDITPTGAMGKIMQLTYGVLIPQSATANLMTAGITAGSAGATADLLNDLKSGYLLGANPRRQFIAQAAGIFSGTIATVACFHLLVPDATALTGIGDQPPAFPAPAAQAWLAVAKVFQLGIESMHPMHQQAILIGVTIGAILITLEQFVPKNIKTWLPSATGLGLGFILPFQYPLSMLIGAIIAAVWTSANEKQAEDYVVPLASGIIAGVSIIGVMVAMANNFLIPPFPG